MLKKKIMKKFIINIFYSIYIVLFILWTTICGGHNLKGKNKNKQHEK